MVKDKKNPSEEGFLRRTLTGLFVKKDKEEDKPSEKNDEDATTNTEQVTKDLTDLTVQLALTN